MHKADLHHDSNRLQRKLEAIYRLRRTTTKVNWDNAGYLALLDKLGNPHLRLPPVIHVAGTNGKGSVIAFLRSILEADGKSVHVYTSPHLVKVNERIVLSGAEISDDYLEALIDEVMSLNDGAPLSFFEIITAVAFKAFADNPADIVLLEVGMGGRLDCTNIIPNPIVSLINRISLDHTEFLGDTIDAIAKEKAGIIKKCVPCVVGYQGDGDNAAVIHGVVNGVANDCGSSVCFLNENYFIAQHDEGFNVRINAAQYVLPYPDMVGDHQVYNAAMAVVALDLIKDQFPVDMKSIENGCRNAQWSGRLQKLSSDGMAEIWLDSGHNDSAGEVLAAQMLKWRQADARPLYLIVGMLGTKDFMGFLKPFISFVKQMNVVPIAFDPAASRSFEDFSREVNVISPELHMVSSQNLREAVEDIILMDQNARILIAGSVYLAGEAIEIFDV